jgi:hypothetical protein
VNSGIPGILGTVYLIMVLDRSAEEDIGCVEAVKAI